MLIGTLRLAVLIGTQSVSAGAPSLIPSGCIDANGKVISCPGSATTTASGCNFTTGVLASDCLPGYLAYLIGVIFTLTGAVFLIMLIIGGYQYVLGSSGLGNKEEGTARIRFAIIGFLVTALSFYIVEFVLNVALSS
jgi:TRAP-type C4-dicarboxylate transport system permease small subunit